MVIVDRYTKYAYFLGTSIRMNAADLAQLFIRFVFAEHGPPNEIITDRAPLFMSNFWKELNNSWGSTLKFSTAYHPQTDGQTERLNSYLEQYLRAYINNQQNNWDTLLPMAQYHYNSSYHNTIKMTPFEALKGYVPEYIPMSSRVTANPSAAELINQLLDLDLILSENLKEAIQYYKYYADCKRRPCTLEEGDLVYLSTKNLKIEWPTKKLGPKNIGPFIISKKIGPVTFQLQLPEKFKIHNVFHASLLTKQQEDPLPHQQIKEDIEWEKDPENRHPEEILSTKLHYGRTLHLVKWKGFPIEDATWEAPEEILGMKKLSQPEGIPLVTNLGGDDVRV